MLSRTLSTLFVGAVLAVTSVHAQVRAYGGNGERAHATRMFLTPDFQSKGNICIQYGQPDWKPEYQKMLGKVPANQMMRLGKDYWTTMNTDVALTIAGVKVPAGSYVLGMATDEGGNFWLAIMDATKLKTNKATPFNSTTWKVDMKAKFERKAVEAMADKLTISLDEVDGAAGKLTLKLHWGKNALVAPVQAHIQGGADSRATSRKTRG